MSILGDFRIRHVAEHRGRGRLAVGVDDQHPIALERQVMGEIDAGRRLADAAFEVLAGNDERRIGADRARAGCRSAPGRPGSAPACNPRGGCCRDCAALARGRCRLQPGPGWCGPDPPFLPPRSGLNNRCSVLRWCGSAPSSCMRSQKVLAAGENVAPTCQSRAPLAHSSPQEGRLSTDFGSKLTEIRA